MTSFENFDIISRKCGYSALFVDIIDGWPEWLSVVPEPAASSNRRWSDISSARGTYSDRSLLLIASLYRSTALFILATSLFHVKGAAIPSSKKDRGSVAACGGPSEGFVKEVREVPVVGNVLPMERVGCEKVSPRCRLVGDIPLFIESMDVAGDIPSESIDWRFWG
jgi:hypothetical protein